MDKLNRNFVRGNILKAEELNELVGKINEFAKCVNDNSLETNKAAMQNLKPFCSKTLSTGVGSSRASARRGPRQPPAARYTRMGVFSLSAK